MESRKRGKTCHDREDLLQSHGMKQMQARESKDGLENLYFLVLRNFIKQELNKEVDNLFRSTSHVNDNPNSNKKWALLFTAEHKMTLKFSGIGLITSINPYHSSLPAALTWRSTTAGKMHQNLWPSKKTTAENSFL